MNQNIIKKKKLYIKKETKIFYEKNQDKYLFYI